MATFAIFSVLSIYFHQLSNPLTQLYHPRLMVHAIRIETGLDWELIVQCALLLRCIRAKVNDLGGPFKICVLGCKPDILCLTLVAEYNLLVSARQIITAEMLMLENATMTNFTEVLSCF